MKYKFSYLQIYLSIYIYIYILIILSIYTLKKTKDCRVDIDSQCTIQHIIKIFKWSLHTQCVKSVR